MLLLQRHAHERFFFFFFSFLSFLFFPFVKMVFDMRDLNAYLCVGGQEIVWLC